MFTNMRAKQPVTQPATRERQPLPLAEMLASLATVGQVFGVVDYVKDGKALEVPKKFILAAVAAKDASEEPLDLYTALQLISPIMRFALKSSKIAGIVDTLDVAMDEGFLTKEMIENFDPEMLNV